jgi:hypothetical protein
MIERVCFQGFNVKHFKERKKHKDFLFINFRLAVNML